MKLHKILPIIFLIIAMMISCSQETVINENISGEATTPDTKICVNIKTENSRTVRPEITKWEITVTNKSDTNLEFSRTIDGKATSATFVNITDGEYEITVRGFNKDNKIILKNGSNSFYIKPNTVNVCEIIPEDYFDYYDDNGNPRIGNLNIQISGLKDLFTEGETLLLTCTKLGSNDKTSKSETLPYEYTNGTLIRGITGIPVGSYKIEITHNDEAKTKTKVNLVKDPVVNIYDNTTTEINWEWNYDSKEINTDQKLKGIKIPVWNKPVFNPDFLPAESSAPAKNGYLSANALFAEPTWDEEESYNFEYTDEKGISCNATNIQPSEFDFINCAYDNIGNLWVLSGTKSTISFYNENDEFYVERFCYVLKNLSTGENYKFSCSDSLAQDFTVATVGEQKYLFYITSDGYNIKSFKFRDEDNWNIDEGTPYCSYGGNQYITAIYAKGDQLYIAISDIENETGSRFIKILKTELAADGSDNILEYKDDDGSEVLKLDINSFIEVENGYSFQSPAFAISDMYINDDKSKLYVTAGCVNYDGNSWNNNLDYGVYHSFGGLFVYDITENNEIPVISSDVPGKYGIYEDNDENNPFANYNLDNTTIMQAETADSLYFAGPRYIIPAGEELLIVDSGFYGVYTTPNDNLPLINCEKRNRIFTFNINENNDESEELIFNSITTLDDSISFDYDYLTSSL